MMRTLPLEMSSIRKPFDRMSWAMETSPHNQSFPGFMLG